MKGNYNEALSLPKNLLQITLRANTTWIGPLSQSSRLSPLQTRPGVGRDEDWRSYESLSDGSNMALMLIRLVFWPASCAFLPSQDSIRNVQLWQLRDIFKDAAAAAAAKLLLFTVSAEWHFVATPTLAIQLWWKYHMCKMAGLKRLEDCPRKTSTQVKTN